MDLLWPGIISQRRILSPTTQAILGAVLVALGLFFMFPSPTFSLLYSNSHYTGYLVGPVTVVYIVHDVAFSFYFYSVGQQVALLPYTLHDQQLLQAIVLFGLGDPLVVSVTVCSMEAVQTEVCGRALSPKQSSRSVFTLLSRSRSRSRSCSLDLLLFN